MASSIFAVILGLSRRFSTGCFVKYWIPPTDKARSIQSSKSLDNENGSLRSTFTNFTSVSGLVRSATTISKILF
jgi:hypothetical protein